MEKVFTMSETYELSFCPGCGMLCKDEDLIMCLACGSVYCGKGSCRVVCLCQDEGSMPIPNRPTKELFTRLVRGNPSAVIIKDSSGRVIHSTDNDSILIRALGLSSCDLIGRTNSEMFCQPESMTLNRIEFEVISRQRPFRFVTNLTTRKGTVRRFMVEVSPYEMTPGDHLTITTLTPAATSMTCVIPSNSYDLYELQPCGR